MNRVDIGPLAGPELTGALLQAVGGTGVQVSTVVANGERDLAAVVPMAVLAQTGGPWREIARGLADELRRVVDEQEDSGADRDEEARGMLRVYDAAEGGGGG
jgi:hypothetical protein